MKKQTFLYKKTGKCDSATKFILGADYAKWGQYVCLQNISAVDLDHASTQLDLGFRRGADFLAVKSFAAPAAGFTVTRETEIWCFLDDMPAVQVLGGTVGDEIEIVVAGYILYDDTEAP